jgi:hypothetical protein
MGEHPQADETPCLKITPVLQKLLTTPIPLSESPAVFLDKAYL